MGSERFVAKRILLVEDSASSAMLVKSVFAGEAEVLHHESLAAGLACAAETPIDVVLLDLNLPDSAGLETLRRFRQHFPDLPLAVLTGTSDEEIGWRALELDAQDFLIKDETYPRLLRRQTNYAVHRKREQLALRAAKEVAEQAARLRDQFVSLVVHDLRSPLASMVGLAEVLCEEEASLGDEQRELIEHIVSSGTGLLAVVEELLDISRLQLGKVTPVPRFQDPHYAVRQILQRLGQVAREKGIAIENQIIEGGRIFADPVLFGQVLQNLVSNAIKFTPAGGRIRVFIPPTRHGAIAVQDKGVGVPEEVLPRLFRMEEKVSTPGTAGEKGSGFGLPYSFNIMQAHGGRLWAESRAGGGSTFYAELPEVQPRVLLVDDQPSVRQAMAGMLAPLKLSVREASGGAEALALMKRERPHLVLLDIIMADMDGFQFLEELEADPSLSQVPVIVVTGDDKIETRERAFALGAVDFTVKPVIPHDLIPRVRHVVA